MTNRSPHDYLFKLFIEGSSYVGKTSLCLRMTEDAFEKHNLCTIGVDFRIKTIELDSKLIKVQCWDLTGSERLRPPSSAFYRRLHGFFVVYDVTDRASFMDVSRWLSVILAHSQNGVILLLGNKSDLATQRAVSFEEGKALADEFRVSFMETSAKTSANVAAALKAMAAEVKARIEANIMSYDSSHLRSVQAATVNSSTCY
jgi:Ras-related protein Rab-1A